MNYADNKDFIELCELLHVDAEWFPEFDDYTAAPDFLLEIAKAVLKMEGHPKIVECGSGISTLVIAKCLHIIGSGNLSSLEHDPVYSIRTHNWLKGRGLLNYTMVYLIPLIGDPPWYDLKGVDIEPFDMLIIDAPPGYIHPQARYGAIALFPFLKKGGIVYADDATREVSVFAQWAKDFPSLNWTLLQTERGLAVGVLGEVKKSVLVAVPNNGSIHKLVSFALLNMQLDQRYRLRIIQPTHSPSDNNRHHIFRDFLAGGEDYLLMIDSDNPPMNNPLDLVELDRDVMGYPTPVWHYTGKIKGERPIYENVYKYVPDEDAYKEWPDKVGLQKPDAVGTGCIMIARRVLEHPKMQGANQRTLNKDGTVDKGGDIMFCETARKCGFGIWAHYNYRCQHFVELELHEVAKAFHELDRGK